MKTIYIGAGCFWGTEGYYQKIKGVFSTEVGYANGPTNKTTYEQVSNGSGHVEVTKLEFDESILSVAELFHSFIRIVNPYSLNKQGNDVGKQYRIGFYSEDRDLLFNIEKNLQIWELKNDKSVVEVMEIKNYVAAENVHQAYLEKNPSGYCHINLNNIPIELQK